MNWTTLLRFRQQVEDLAREEVVLAEWEKSQTVSKREEFRDEIETVVSELERRIRMESDTMFVEQRYQWLDQLSETVQAHTERIHDQEQKLVALRHTLKNAYHARRVVELVIAKKEEQVLQKIAAQEQSLQDDITAHAYAIATHEEMA